jgi:hypothetical protein
MELNSKEVSTYNVDVDNKGIRFEKEKYIVQFQFVEKIFVMNCCFIFIFIFILFLFKYYKKRIMLFQNNIFEYLFSFNHHNISQFREFFSSVEKKSKKTLLKLKNEKSFEEKKEFFDSFSAIDVSLDTKNFLKIGDLTLGDFSRLFENRWMNTMLEDYYM